MQDVELIFLHHRSLVAITYSPVITAIYSQPKVLFHIADKNVKALVHAPAHHNHSMQIMHPIGLSYYSSAGLHDTQFQYNVCCLFLINNLNIDFSKDDAHTLEYHKNNFH